MDNSNAGEITVNSENNIENVKEFLEKNDIVGAKKFLNSFMEINPNNQQAMFIMAQLYEAEGNFAEAAKLYEIVFGDEISPEFFERVLHVYESADKYDRVYNIHKKQYDNNPDNMDICERFAHTCCIVQKYDEAIEAYNTILAKQPENFVALRQLSDIYEQTNQMMFHLTNAKLAQIEQNYEKAEKEYKKAFTLAEKEDDILQIRYQMAKLYRFLGKNEQALDEYIYILSATEENFAVFIELAEIYLELNNPASAISTLKRALKVYSDNTDAMQMLADTYADTENYAEAENYYEKLLELDSSNVENMVNLAKVYLQLDKIDKTKEVLLTAENKDPNSTEVLTALAGFYTFTEDYDKAKNYCNRIVQKLPDSPLGYKKFAQLYDAMGNAHLSHYNYGVYHELREELEDAINEYSVALQYKKDDFEVIKKLAGIHERINEPDMASDYYHMLFDAKIDFIETTKKLVSIYMSMNEYDMAQRYLDAALKEENHTEFMFLNAKCMYKQKDFEGALESLQLYKEKTKSLENIEETNKLIEEIENKKEDSLNPLAKFFRFLDK